ncbi:transmembrane protein 138 isoform X3 [Heterocephalus glaber]|uniref:Transmembrane protein 138 n=1 Tax=Heterocephalus glaber TaxID=10181 RepID=A0AAX6SEW9_HETGA|nr:transmembrane protein 138 isoform X3 [Heterocephalus glaber]
MRGPCSSTRGTAVTGRGRHPSWCPGGTGMWPGPRKQQEDAPDQQLQPCAVPAVPAAGLRPLCQRVLRAPPDGTCRPAGALHAGLVSLLFRKFKGTIILTAMYFALSISLHMWVMNLRWRNSLGFVWTSGLQALFVLQRLAAVLYCYFYKRTALRLADPRFYRDSQWLRKEFLQG